jgi:hypothetical protein
LPLEANASSGAEAVVDFHASAKQDIHAISRKAIDPRVRHSLPQYPESNLERQQNRTLDGGSISQPKNSNARNLELVFVLALSMRRYRGKRTGKHRPLFLSDLVWQN